MYWKGIDGKQVVSVRPHTLPVRYVTHTHRETETEHKQPAASRTSLLTCVLIDELTHGDAHLLLHCHRPVHVPTDAKQLGALCNTNVCVRACVCVYSRVCVCACVCVCLCVTGMCMCPLMQNSLVPCAAQVCVHLCVCLCVCVCLHQRSKTHSTPAFTSHHNTPTHPRSKRFPQNT